MADYADANPPGLSTEARTNMRKQVLTVLAGLLIAAVTIQTAAAARHGRKPARAPVAATQPRDVSHGPSAPAATGNKSCDIIWCYQD
jgi:hypothetical protein